MAFRASGQWQKTLVPTDVDESFRLAQARTTMLGVRVRDESVRDLVESFKTHCTRTAYPSSRENNAAEMQNMSGVFDQLNKKIGEILRTLDDETRNVV